MPPSAAAAVTNLGVVGRGKGRITLQPAAATGGGLLAGGSTGAFATASTAAAGTAAEAPKKRSLKDVMGALLAHWTKSDCSQARLLVSTCRTQVVSQGTM